MNHLSHRRQLGDLYGQTQVEKLPHFARLRVDKQRASGKASLTKEEGVLLSTTPTPLPLLDFEIDKPQHTYSIHPDSLAIILHIVDRLNCQRSVRGARFRLAIASNFFQTSYFKASFVSWTLSRHFIDNE